MAGVPFFVAWDCPCPGTLSSSHQQDPILLLAWPGHWEPYDQVPPYLESLLGPKASRGRRISWVRMRYPIGARCLGKPTW